MKDRHIAPEDLLSALGNYGFLEGDAALEVQFHFLRRCPVCLGRVLAYFGFQSAEELAALPDLAGELDRRHEVRLGEAAVAWLATLPAAERAARARQDGALHQREVVESLLARCQELAPHRPEEARAWAEVAVEVAPRVKGPWVDHFVRHELSARAWAHLGNVLRILSDLRGADEAFRQAQARLDAGIFDDAVIPEVKYLEASLRRAQRRFAEAQAAVDEAIGWYGEYERWDLQGQGLLKSAKIRTAAGDLEGALQDLRRAVPLLDPREDPRLPFVAASIELHLLCETGRFAEAQALAPEARRLADAHGSPTDRLRVRWCEGRIAAALGPAAEAEAAFREVREGFIREGIGYDAALVSLELALLYLGEGRAAEVRQLAREMVPIFDSRDVHAGALAALALFHEAAEKDRLTAQRLAELARYLRQARHDPTLPFQPVGGP